MTPDILIEISEDNADPTRLDQLSRYLLRDLRQLGLTARRPASQAPPGTKSGSAITIATLLVGLAGTPASRALVNGIFGWLGPRKGRVKISYGDASIEVSAANPAERDRLFEWLETCTKQPPGRDQQGRDDKRSS